MRCVRRLASSRASQPYPGALTLGLARARRLPLDKVQRAWSRSDLPRGFIAPDQSAVAAALEPVAGGVEVGTRSAAILNDVKVVKRKPDPAYVIHRCNLHWIGCGTRPIVVIK